MVKDGNDMALMYRENDDDPDEIYGKASMCSSVCWMYTIMMHA
jgi:hypothetical protein